MLNPFAITTRYLPKTILSALLIQGNPMHTPIIPRPFWQNRIEESWKERTVIWLMGVRGPARPVCAVAFPTLNTLIANNLAAQLLQDPEGFLESQRGKRIALDDIHRLDNPSELLKIAADHYPEVKIIATGSSTLRVNPKFKDTLTGRKREIWLTPMLLQEMPLFGNYDIRHRFLFGGSPLFSPTKNYLNGTLKNGSIPIGKGHL